MPRPNFISKGKKLAEIVRVNHAGEYGAKRIYEGQIKFTENLHDKILIGSMLEQEKVHLNYFENQLKVRKVRPTLFMPLWNIGGYMIGAISAKLGLKSAMLVTEAVEDIIESHYLKQLEYLENIRDEQELVNNIKQFREDELAHMATAIDHESKQAYLASICTKIIKSICRNAIFLSKKL